MPVAETYAINLMAAMPICIPVSIGIVFDALPAVPEHWQGRYATSHLPNTHMDLAAHPWGVHLPCNILRLFKWQKEAVKWEHCVLVPQIISIQCSPWSKLFCQGQKPGWQIRDGTCVMAPKEIPGRTTERYVPTVKVIAGNNAVKQFVLVWRWEK